MFPVLDAKDGFGPLLSLVHLDAVQNRLLLRSILPTYGKYIRWEVWSG